jgi:drug/metabolite transporter (DMT)-like permease
MAGFIVGLIPILVAAGGWFVLGARVGRLGQVGLVLGLVGLLVLVWPAAPTGRAVDTTRGILLQVVAAVSFAAHVLLMSHYGARLPALPFCTWQLVLVTTIAGIAVAFDGRLGAHADVAPTPALFLLLAYLGVVATAVGIAGQSVVQPKVPALHVALLFATQPLFAAITGWATLGEALTTRELAGAAAIVAGVVVTAFGTGRVVTPATVSSPPA